MDPLPELLFAGMKLTIAFDDISLPLPTMRPPDIRGRIIEHVLTMAADAGVDDVELIAANALHRRMTAAELKHIVGERVFRSFYPQGKLYNFDAEDRDNLSHLGTTEKGEDIEISKRAAESDLLVYVNVNLVAMDGGHKSVGIGLASYKSLRHHHNAKTMVQSRSFMDHKHSAMHHSAWRIGRVIKDTVKVFQIETTLNNDIFPKPYDFLQKREWEWSVKDQALDARRCAAGCRSRRRSCKHKMFHDLRSVYGLTGVNAGEVEAVHTRTLEKVHQQHLVEVQGQSDVLVMGIPYVGPYNVNSSLNPILATCMGLGYYFNSYIGQPVVRKGGAVILYHPLNEGFNQLHHPSYVDFYEEVLAESTDPAVVGEKYEQQFAEDPWYRHLYRTSHAYHGVHPFYMWYWAAHAMDHVDEVIWVGADRQGRVPARASGPRPRSRTRWRWRPARSASARRSPTCTTRRTCWRTCDEQLHQGAASTTSGWSRAAGAGAGARRCRARRRSSCRPRSRRSSRTDWSRQRPAMAAREVAQKVALEPLFRSQVRTRVEGLDVLERIDGPVIFVANHASHLDTPLILLSLPDEWRRRTAVAAAADYFFDTWWRAVGSSLLFNTFPIDRRGGTMAATPGEVLADGWSLVIFPEGTRSTDGWMGKFRMGAAFLAKEHGVPVVPVAHRGTYAAMPRGQGWPSPRSPAADDPLRRAAGRRAGRVGARVRAADQGRRRRAPRRGPDDLVGGPAAGRRRRRPRPVRTAGRAVAPGLGADRVARSPTRRTRARPPGGAERRPSA